ncbi:hypothetical protein IAU59_004630 [Kwoniella sp. CBS 9459]
MSALLDPLLETVDNGKPIATAQPDDEPDEDKDKDTSPGLSSDSDNKNDDMAAVTQITSASAVSQPAAVVSTSAAVATPNPAQPAATSSTSARVQNPATPQNTIATSSTSSVVSSAAAAVSSATRALTSSSSSTTSAAVRTSTTSPAAATSTRAATSSTTSSASRSSASSSRSSSSSSASRTSSISSSASATKAAAEGKGGVGGSGLSIGALIGIIAGSVVGVILIAMVVTRTVRKKQRRDRAARRSSMFEWPATGMDEEPYEKPRYDPPSQSYAMSDSYNNGNSNPAQTVSYMTNETSYAPVPAAVPVPGPASSQSYMERNNPQHAYPSYPPQQQQQQYGQQQYPVYQENVVPPSNAGPAAGPVGAGAAAGLRDASWVRVKVGFVRSLEDELAISPGQQLYLHTAYDDGWSLCEDAKQNRGVVPISCLEPWSDSAASSGGGLAPTSMSREGSTGSAGSGERLQRRSSLYRGDK